MDIDPRLNEEGQIMSPLEKQIAQLKKENAETKAQVAHLQKKNMELEKRIAELETKNLK